MANVNVFIQKNKIKILFELFLKKDLKICTKQVGLGD